MQAGVPRGAAGLKFVPNVLSILGVQGNRGAGLPARMGIDVACHRDSRTSNPVGNKGKSGCCSSSRRLARAGKAPGRPRGTRPAGIGSAEASCSMQSPGKPPPRIIELTRSNSAGVVVDDDLSPLGCLGPDQDGGTEPLVEVLLQLDQVGRLGLG